MKDLRANAGKTKTVLVSKGQIGDFGEHLCSV